MSEAKHTPGPWHSIWDGEYVLCEADRGKVIGGSIYPADYKDRFAIPICRPVVGDQVPHGLRPQEECAANVRLITAAPELLAACLLALPHLVNEPAADAVRDAIAKAHGMTPAQTALARMLANPRAVDKLLDAMMSDDVVDADGRPVVTEGDGDPD